MTHIEQRFYGTCTKKNLLCDMLLHICFEENKDYISLSDFIVKK